MAVTNRTALSATVDPDPRARYHSAAVLDDGVRLGKSRVLESRPRQLVVQDENELGSPRDGALRFEIHIVLAYVHVGSEGARYHAECGLL